MFLRLPFFAAFMVPWSRLPFWPAFTLWRIANLAAIGVFIWLCFPCREWSLLACAWSMPIAYGIFNGQDIGFLLMWVAAALALVRRGSPVLAGIALAMCAEKPHLFLLLPLLIFRGRYRKIAYGFIAANLCLLILSFAIQPIDWPNRFFQALKSGQIDPTPASHFNLFGLVHGNGRFEAVLAIGVVLLAFYICRSSDLQFGLAAVLTGSLLVSHHQTPSDAALLIPVALILVFHARPRYSKVIAIFLISPLAYFLLITPDLALLPGLLLLFLMALLAREVRSFRTTAVTECFTWTSATLHQP